MRTKKEINEIRTNWGAKIQVITDAVRKIIKLGDSEMVWRRISQLRIISRNNKQKPYGELF